MGKDRKGSKDKKGRDMSVQKEVGKRTEGSR